MKNEKMTGPYVVEKFLKTLPKMKCFLTIGLLHFFYV